MTTPTPRPRCQHRMGHYRAIGPRVDDSEFGWCGKLATHVAEYPGRPPSYFCRKHAKTRCYTREISSGCRIVKEEK